jgi:phenylacetate-coenzyme A ligase PaaK-like adenylate-forming protein
VGHFTSFKRAAKFQIGALLMEYSPEYLKKSLEVLETSLGQLGAYKAWRKLDPGPALHVDKRYAALPALTKRDIREHFPQGFVPPGRDIEKGLGNGEIQIVTTSGSSDAVRVTNIWSQTWWDASERASWKLNAHAARFATGSHPEAILVNARNVGIISDDIDLPFEKRRLDRFLYLNEKTDPAAWTPQLMDRMINELNIFKPVILEANASFLAKLCRYAAMKKIKVYQPGLIVFTYEFPSKLFYRQIRKVFTGPIASSYGSTETGYVFMECEAGKLHQNSDSCRVDFQPLSKEHGGPLTGRILITTFNNPWYYMLRFDVGDFIRLDKTQKCACGRSSGLIAEAIEGRFTNATLTCDGHLITLRTLDDALSVLEGLDEYKLEQTSHGVYVLYIASQRREKNALDKEAEEIIRALYGRKADITIIHKEFLAPEDSGKYSLAKTLFPLNINDYLDTH